MNTQLATLPYQPTPTGYPADLDREARLAVQVLALSSRSLVAQAKHGDPAATGYDHREFARLVRQLVVQRQLAEEILVDCIEACDFDDDVEDLREALERMCRNAEMAVLAGQATLARAAGEANLAARIERLAA